MSMSSRVLFLRRDWAGGAGPVVEAPRAGVDSGGAAFVPVEAPRLPRAGALPRDGADVAAEVDGAVLVAPVVSAGCEEPRLGNRPPSDGAEVVVGAALDVAVDEAPGRLGKRFEPGADVAGVDEPRLGNRFEDGADVAGVEAGWPKRVDVDAAVAGAADAGVESLFCPIPPKIFEAAGVFDAGAGALAGVPKGLGLDCAG